MVEDARPNCLTEFGLGSGKRFGLRERLENGAGLVCSVQELSVSIAPAVLTRPEVKTTKSPGGIWNSTLFTGRPLIACDSGLTLPTETDACSARQRCGFIEREIIYKLLRGPEGARLRAIATVGDQNQRTAKAIAWIKANYSKPLRIEELAEVAGIAVSTLHHHFRALTTMSPLQYQKQLGLQAARARMLTDDMDTVWPGNSKRFFNFLAPRS